MTDPHPPASAPPGPLAGIVVCELATVLAGPYCGMLLADLGADVIKVEPPEGDGTRSWGPPYAGAPEPGVDYPAGDPRARPGYRGESAYYLSVNRNKRGLRLDLRPTAGREVLERLLARSDVLLENHRVGRLERLGFPDDRLAEVNPRLIHLAITGFGPDGPYAERPGYDFVIQAMAGLMSITGQPDEAGGEPTKVGVAIADLATGMLGAVAVLGALTGRERAGSPAAGRGQRIDISLFESTLAWLANQAGNYLVGGSVPGRLGNRHPNITPYETFRTPDGIIAVAVGSERQWPRFCEALGLPRLAADPRFATNTERVRHREVLTPILEAQFATLPTSDWFARLSDAGIPCGPINDLAAAFADPQVAARQMVVSTRHPTVGEVRLPGVPFKLAATPATARSAPPLLGQHTDEILAWLGYGDAAIDALHAAGVV